MIQFPNISPKIIDIGRYSPTWYGMMYVVGFAALYFLLAKYRAKRSSIWNQELVGDLLTYIMFGVILGGRIGYVLFYGMEFWAQDPWYIFKIRDGGMSFHGGLIGVSLACLLFGHRKKISFLQIMDFIAPACPVGLFFGRIGNFINGELWGKVTDLPWGIVFPHAGPLPRHPSMLYEACLEGLLMFIVLWTYSAHKRPLGRVSGLFLILYGLSRFVVEFVREPDPQLGYLAWNWLTMGQILSFPMILLGLFLFFKPIQNNEAIS